VESGIRPYRGPGGIWTEHGEPPLDGYQKFISDPKKWWEKRLGKPVKGREDVLAKRMAKRLEANPNPGHYALAELEAIGVLQALITQNVDNLHLRSGSTNVFEIHGNATKLRCISCNARFSREEFQIHELPPQCPRCSGIVKSDGVMFGEPIPSDVLERCQRVVRQCDCMLVAGTSALVYPTASFPRMAKENGATVIEVNVYETVLTPFCDVVLQGPSGRILPALVTRVKQRMNR
jgi:NAD-dependent deacetylase